MPNLAGKDRPQGLVLLSQSTKVLDFQDKKKEMVSWELPRKPVHPDEVKTVLRGRGGGSFPVWSFIHTFTSGGDKVDIGNIRGSPPGS